MGKYVITNCDDIPCETTKVCHIPFAFTEHGVTMLANVLKSTKARQTSITIVRAFISLKQFTLDYKGLALKIEEFENKYDNRFKDVYEAINYLLQKDKEELNQKERKQIGFKPENQAQKKGQ